MNVFRVFADGIFAEKDWFIESAGSVSPEQITDLHVRAVYKVLLSEYFSGGALPDIRTFPDLIGRKYPEKVARILTEYVLSVEHRIPSREEFTHAVRMMLFEGKKGAIRENMAKALGMMEKNKLSGIGSILTEGLDAYEQDGSAEIDARRGVTSFLEDYSQPLLPGIPTGIPQLDYLTGGGRPTDLWVWGAYTGECKTTGMMEVAYHMVRHGHPVLWITLEMSVRQMEEMFIIRNAHQFREGGLDAREAQSRIMSPEDFQVFETAAMDWRDNPDYGALHIWKPSRRVTMNAIETKMRSMKNLIGAQALILDYLDLVVPRSKRSDYRIEVMEKFKDAKGVAEDLGIFTLTGHQISRGGRDKAAKRGYYELADLAESSGVEQNVNLAMWTLRTPKLMDSALIRWGVMKIRRGATLFRGQEAEEDLVHGRIAFDPDEEYGQGQQEVPF